MQSCRYRIAQDKKGRGLFRCAQYALRLRLFAAFAANTPSRLRYCPGRAIRAAWAAHRVAADAPLGRAFARFLTRHSQLFAFRAKSPARFCFLTEMPIIV